MRTIEAVYISCLDFLLCSNLLLNESIRTDWQANGKGTSLTYLTLYRQLSMIELHKTGNNGKSNAPATRLLALDLIEPFENLVLLLIRNTLSRISYT